MTENFARQWIDPTKLPRQVVEKWSASALSEGYVPVPKKLVRCLKRILGDTDPVLELAALLAVVDFKRPNLTRSPSSAYLAFLAGLEKDEFDAALRRLETRGFVRISGDSEALDVSLAGLLDAVESETKEFK